MSRLFKAVCLREIKAPKVRKDAWFSEGDGNIWINNATPSYKKAARWGVEVKRYHVLRSSIDALLEWVVINKKMTLAESFDARTELLRKWGESK